MDYLTEKQIKELMGACKEDRQSYRNSSLILIGFRHGLRRSEICDLTWQDINLEDGFIFCRRKKGSVSGYHPLKGEEIRRLRRLKRQNKQSLYCFESQQKTQLSRKMVEIIISRAGQRIGLKITPHILRHSCGFHLVNQGLDTRLVQVYLGHKNIQNTITYTKVAHHRFMMIEWTPL